MKWRAFIDKNPRRPVDQHLYTPRVRDELLVESGLKQLIPIRINDELRAEWRQRLTHLESGVTAAALNQEELNGRKGDYLLQAEKMKTWLKEHTHYQRPAVDGVIDAAVDSYLQLAAAHVMEHFGDQRFKGPEDIGYGGR